MTDRSPLRRRASRSVGLALVTAVAVAACGGTSSPHAASTTTTSTSTLDSSTTVATTTTATTPTHQGIIQGTDNNNTPYGDFDVAIKIAPHLSSQNPDGGGYTPSSPLQPDGTCQDANGFCDPAGYKYILFTLRYTNPTSKPEQFGTVGFSSAIGSMVYPTAPSHDQGLTPDTSFGSPTNGLAPLTKQDTTTYWQAARKGPGDLYNFPPPFATSHFIFQATPAGKYFGITGGPPNVLAPHASFDIDYGTTGVVAPKTPLSNLTLWVGIHPQQVH